MAANNIQPASNTNNNPRPAQNLLAPQKQLDASHDLGEIPSTAGKHLHKAIGWFHLPVGASNRRSQ
jgi:hypothetical protein